jgi:hypothetical protein
MNGCINYFDRLYDRIFVEGTRTIFFVFPAALARNLLKMLVRSTVDPDFIPSTHLMILHGRWLLPAARFF